MYDMFDNPALVEKIAKFLQKPKPEVISENEELQEVSAPGQESWIKANKARFEKEYGVEKGKEVLYAKAWKMHEEETEHDQKKVAVSPRHEDDSKVLLEKGKKKDVDEAKEKIIFDPEVHPDRINEPDKNQRTV